MTLNLSFAAMVLLGYLCQWLAWRVRLPAILFLLLSGLVLGPVFGVLDPASFDQQWIRLFVALAVAIILFEGSLTLRFSEIRGLGPTILRLVSLGAVVSLLGLAAAAHYIAGLEWPLALLFGALTCVTGPTVIVPMLRSVHPNARISNVLRWEGIIIDPIGALFAVLVYEALALNHGGQGVAVFGWTVLTGIMIGLLAAFALGFALRRQWIPDYLQNYGTLALLLMAFSASNAINDESGLLAVTVMGMTLANMRGLHIHGILWMHEHLSIILISMLFIVLAASLQMPSLMLALAGLGILIVAMAVVRPFSILISTLGSRLSWRERALLAWIAPRGIVAAAVSGLFAIRLQEQGYPNAQALVTLTFILIIGTVVIQSATSRRLALKLGVAEAAPRGVLIIGANRVARELATALKKQNYEPVLADEDWHDIRAARMAGLPTYYGNPVTERAEMQIGIERIGWLLAMSTRREINALAGVRHRPELGRDRVFQLQLLDSGEMPDKRYAAALRMPALFGKTIGYAEFLQRLDEGWTTKTTRLSDSFTWQDFVGQYAVLPLLLFAQNEKGALRFENDDLPLQPKSGWTITALIDPAARVEDKSAASPKVDMEKTESLDGSEQSAADRTG